MSATGSTGRALHYLVLNLIVPLEVLYEGISFNSEQEQP